MLYVGKYFQPIILSAITRSKERFPILKYADSDKIELAKWDINSLRTAPGLTTYTLIELIVVTFEFSLIQDIRVLFFLYNNCVYIYPSTRTFVVLWYDMPKKDQMPSLLNAPQLFILSIASYIYKASFKNCHQIMYFALFVPYHSDTLIKIKQLK